MQTGCRFERTDPLLRFCCKSCFGSATPDYSDQPPLRDAIHFTGDVEAVFAELDKDSQETS